MVSHHLFKSLTVYTLLIEIEHPYLRQDEKLTAEGKTYKKIFNEL